MASYAERPARLPGWSFLLIAVLVGALYLAREVLIPLALAILFSFLLNPAVRRLERWRLGRGLASVATTLLFVAILAGIAWFAGNQAVSLAGKLPEYQENIVAKLRALRSPPKGNLGKAARAIREIEKEIKPGTAPESAQAEKPKAQSSVPANALQLIGKAGISLLGLLASTVAVIVLTALMLVQRDDLRDRLIRVVGEAHIQVTTQAMQDAGSRVSRYLLMQLLVNACYGVPLATALYFIGLPNALLFGLLATVLRFVPYLGAAIVASLAMLLALAISQGWATIAWTFAAVASLEFLTAYVVEPWLYGESTGLSPLAVVFAAIFWTWLWGPVGLILALPLTVSLAAVGRHLPAFGFLYVMLGVQPVLPPPVRFYQRLVSMEYEEALELAEAHAQEHGVVAMLDQVMLPALLVAKRDRQRSALDDRHERFALESLERIAEDAGAGGESPPGRGPRPVIDLLPAHDDVDGMAAEVLARAATSEHYETRLFSHEKLASELVEELAREPGEAVCISAVPPSAAANAAYLCKRLRRRLPKQKILVALWHANSNVEALKRRLQEAGADEVVTRLPEALERLRLLVPAAAGERI